MRVSSVKFENRKVEKRVRCFIDYFHYLSKDGGRIEEFYFFSHLSLIKEILDRVNRRGKFSSSKKVLSLLVVHELFNTKTDLISRKGDVSKLVKKLKSAYGVDNYDEMKVVGEKLLSFLGGDNGDLYVKNILDSIGELIVEKGENNISEKIYYYTKLLVAEFKGKGFTEKELVGTNGIFNRILSSEYEIPNEFGNKIYTRIPLPKNILKLKGSDKYVEEVVNYIKGRSFADQLLEVYRIYDLDSSKKFIIPITEVMTSGEKVFDIIIDQVRFTVRSELNIDADNKDIIDFFFKNFDDKNTIYAEVKILYNSTSSGIRKAYQIVRDEFYSLNLFFGTGGRIVRDRIAAHGGGVWHLFNLTDLRVHRFSRTFETFLSQRKVLSSADFSVFKLFSLNDLRDVVLYAWNTIEVSMKQLLNDNELSSDRCIKLYVKQLAKSEEYRLNSFFHNSIVNLVFNSDPKTISRKLNGPALNQFIDKNRSKGIESIYKLAIHPFLDWLYWLKNSNGLDEINSRSYYYKLLLCELYEQRNLILHDNSPRDSSIERIALVSKELIKWWKLHEIKSRE